MRCKKCGKELESTWKACPECGEPVNAENEYKKGSPTKRPIYKRIWFWILLAIACFIGLGIYGGSLPDEETDKEVEKKEVTDFSEYDFEELINKPESDAESIGLQPGKEKNTYIGLNGDIEVTYSSGTVQAIHIAGDAEKTPALYGIRIGMGKEDAMNLLADTYDMLVNDGDSDFIRVNSETLEATGCALNGGLVNSIEYRILSEEEFAEVQNFVNASLYIFPDSDKRYLTEDEVRALDAHQLLLGRNEIFARHGRMFDMQELADYFNSQPWYSGTIPADQFDSSVLNDYERTNADLIKRIEDEKNGTGTTSFTGKMGVYCSTTQPGGIETGRVEVIDLGNGSVQVDLGWLGGAVLLSETAQIVDGTTAQFTTYGITVTLIWSGDSNLTMIRSGGSLGDSYLDEITNGLNFVWAAEFN